MFSPSRDASKEGRAQTDRQTDRPGRYTDSPLNRVSAHWSRLLCAAGAMVIQVLSLMWMRTTMNYQVKHSLFCFPNAMAITANIIFPQTTKSVPPRHGYDASLEVSVQRRRDPSVLPRLGARPDARYVSELEFRLRV